jgi:thiomorpholine-carboxylate dehydrogenase
MPAVRGGLLGTKLVSAYPENSRLGIYTHFAIIALFNKATGEPMAILDGRLITEMRTAAVSALATDVLARPDARVLTILGSGTQARSHVEILRRVRRFEEVRVWSPTPAHAERFAHEMNARVMPAEQAVCDADVIVTATPAKVPILCGAWLKPGAHVNAVGSVGPGRRELDADAMKNIVVVESREAVLREADEVKDPGVVIHAELGELFAGRIRVSPNETTIYKSVGIAVEDLAAAKVVWEKYLAAAEPRP